MGCTLHLITNKTVVNRHTTNKYPQNQVDSQRRLLFLGIIPAGNTNSRFQLRFLVHGSWSKLF